MCACLLILLFYRITTQQHTTVNKQNETSICFQKLKINQREQQNPLPSKTTALLTLALVTGFQLKFESPSPSILSQSLTCSNHIYIYFLLTRKLKATEAPVSQGSFISV